MTSINSSNKFLPMLKNTFRRNMAHLIVTQIIILLVTISSLRSFLSLKPYEVLDITTKYSLSIENFCSVIFVFESFILGVLECFPPFPPPSVKRSFLGFDPTTSWYHEQGLFTSWSPIPPFASLILLFFVQIRKSPQK